MWSSPSSTKFVSVCGWKSSQPHASSSHSESMNSFHGPSGLALMNLHRNRGHSSFMTFMGLTGQESIAWPVAVAGSWVVVVIVLYPFLERDLLLRGGFSK